MVITDILGVKLKLKSRPRPQPTPRVTCNAQKQHEDEGMPHKQSDAGCLTVRGRAHSSAVGIGEHWDRPYAKGTSQSQGPSKSSKSAVQVALRGLTCEKKTKSTLVKEANLYRNEKMT